MTEVLRLYVLLCGYELLEKTISTKGRGSRFVLAEPISAYLLQTTSGYVLIDAGANSELVNDPKLRQIYYTGRGWNPPVILPQHELSYQLDAIGVAPAQITRIVLSHMHLDHTGNLKLFPGAEVYVQRREYDYAFSADHSPAWFEIDYALPNLRWHLLDGDYELLPGLELITTYGHTPGHQSAIVTLPNSGTLVLTADAGDLHENFDDEVPPGENIGDEVALESIRRLKRVAATACCFWGTIHNSFKLCG
jgi:N-acyl homoserine lactone hydrolase